MKRVWILGCSLIVLLLLAVAPATAGEVLDRIIERGEVRVGMTGNQPPLNVKSKGGELIGLEVDLVQALADSMGVEARLVAKPFAELLPALLKGEIDMVVSGVTITPQRNTKVAFVGPYMLTGKSVLTTSAVLAAADEAEDVIRKDVRLAALEGSTSQEFVEVLLPDAQLKKVKDYDEAIHLLLDEKIDALVADMEACQIAVLRYPEAGMATLDTPLTIEPIGIALPPGDALLVNLVENYLGALEMVGLLDDLRAQWYDDGSWLIRIP